MSELLFVVVSELLIYFLPSFCILQDKLLHVYHPWECD